MYRLLIFSICFMLLAGVTSCGNDDDDDIMRVVPEGFGGEVAVTYNGEVYDGIPGFARLIDTTISIAIDTMLFDTSIYTGLPYREQGDSIYLDLVYNNWLTLFASDIDTSQTNIEGSNFSFIILGYNGPGRYDQLLESESFIYPIFTGSGDEGVWGISFSHYADNGNTNITASQIYLFGNDDDIVEINITSDSDNRIRGIFSYTSDEVDDQGNPLMVTGSFDVPYNR